MFAVLHEKELGGEYNTAAACDNGAEGAMAVEDKHGVVVYHVSEGTMRETAHVRAARYNAPLHGLAVENNRLAMAMADGMLRVFACDAPTTEHKVDLRWPPAGSPSEMQMEFGGSSHLLCLHGTALTIWKASTWTELCNYQDVVAASFARNGSVLVAFEYDVYYGAVALVADTIRTGSAETGAWRCSMTKRVRNASCSADGATISVLFKDGTLALWNGNEKRELCVPGVNAFALDSSGRLAFAVGRSVRTYAGTVHVPQWMCVRRISYSADEKLLAITCEPSTVSHWHPGPQVIICDAANGRRLHTELASKVWFAARMVLTQSLVKSCTRILEPSTYICTSVSGTSKSLPAWLHTQGGELTTASVYKVAEVVVCCCRESDEDVVRILCASTFTQLGARRGRLLAWCSRRLVLAEGDKLVCLGLPAREVEVELTPGDDDFTAAALGEDGRVVAGTRNGLVYLLSFTGSSAQVTSMEDVGVFEEVSMVAFVGSSAIVRLGRCGKLFVQSLGRPACRQLLARDVKDAAFHGDLLAAVRVRQRRLVHLWDMKGLRETPLRRWVPVGKTGLIGSVSLGQVRLRMHGSMLVTYSAKEVAVFCMLTERNLATIRTTSTVHSVFFPCSRRVALIVGNTCNVLEAGASVQNRIAAEFLRFCRRFNTTCSPLLALSDEIIEMIIAFVHMECPLWGAACSCASYSVQPGESIPCTITLVQIDDVFVTESIRVKVNKEKDDTLYRGVVVDYKNYKDYKRQCIDLRLNRGDIAVGDEVAIGRLSYGFYLSSLWASTFLRSPLYLVGTEFDNVEPHYYRDGVLWPPGDQTEGFKGFIPIFQRSL